MEDESIKLEFDINEISRQFLLHIKQTTDNFSCIYFAIDNLNFENIKPLPTDNFPLAIINDKEKEIDNKEKKQNIINWTLTKAFEDIIIGLTKGLKEAYKYLRIHDASLNKSLKWTHELLNAELQQIEIDLEKIHFPSFISKIEELLNDKLYLKDEIISINRTRNCLVHRHAIVKENDTKYSPKNNLCLKWISTSFWTEINGNKKQITFDFRKKGVHVDNLQYKTNNKEKIFKLGERVIIDINEFNDIAYTCVIFSNNLLNLMPQPE